MLVQLLQALGALMILVPYALVLGRKASDSSVPYLASNAFGGALLAVLAATEGSWGFVALEGAWSVVALTTLTRRRALVESVAEPVAELSAEERVADLRGRLVAHDAWAVVFGSGGQCGCSTCVGEGSR